MTDTLYDPDATPPTTPARELQPVGTTDSIQYIASVAEKLSSEMSKAVVGQAGLVEALTVALFSNGHLLLEGVPGGAKTLAVRAFSRLCQVPFGRVQFTPDLMPSDILGSSIYDATSGQFYLRKGPVFAGFLLADEINRTPPKTQSALLEVMEERRVTIDGVSHEVPQPFVVCATQNPIEFEGTYPLPEAQLDRFAMKVILDYPAQAEEEELLTRYQTGFRASDLDTADLQPVVGPEDLVRLKMAVDTVEVAPAVRQYIVAICRMARSSRHLALGPSTRAIILLMLCSKALAAIRGRGFVTPDDVKTLVKPVLRHRLILRPESEIEGHTPDRVLDSVLAGVEVPR